MKVVNIYPQGRPHENVVIVGNKEALQLLGVILMVLHLGEEAATDELPLGEDSLYASDGEGYNITVKCLPDDYLDKEWKQYNPFYYMEVIDEPH